MNHDAKLILFLGALLVSALLFQRFTIWVLQHTEYLVHRPATLGGIFILGATVVLCLVSLVWTVFVGYVFIRIFINSIT